MREQSEINALMVELLADIVNEDAIPPCGCDFCDEVVAPPFSPLTSCNDVFDCRRRARQIALLQQIREQA